MSGTIKATTLGDGTNTVGVDGVIAGTAKAWVNFNAIGTVAITDDFNVASITDNGVGNFTVNFTNAMPNADYVMVGGASANSVSTGVHVLDQPDAALDQTTTYIDIETTYVTSTTNRTNFDPHAASVCIFCNP